jgi:hypothetical protein
MSPGLVLILSGAAIAQAGGGTPDAHPAPATSAAPATGQAADPDCSSGNARVLVVCGQRRQGYRPDSSVLDAAGAEKRARESATSSTAQAQSICGTQPMGCAEGPAALDLANVARVVGTAAVQAAEGKDWKQPFEAGPDEYQLYVQAKRRNAAAEAQRAAQAAKARALRDRAAP